MSSTDYILQIIQKKFHHQLDEISVEEILDVMREISIELGMIQAKADNIRSNQKFIEQLLLDKIKNGVGINTLGKE